ncbi:tryptophan dimethylallyltransferase family protein [Actinosynnema sp.]|uniref:tryptophan dimethylallyltransferase family protein n=1 Tax=Actinosynnema sp. TaxID=1872144 RepID=UPI003F825021
MSTRPAVVHASRRTALYEVAGTAYRDFAAQQWVAACAALDFPFSELYRTLHELDSVLGQWADAPIGEAPRYPSFVSRDGFPLEFSVSWRGGVGEVRVLFESLGAEPTAKGAQEAGRALTRALGALPGVSLDRYLRVEDLYVADDPVPYRPAVWHSLAHRRGEASRYKVYLNPQTRGVDRAHAVMRETMRRLGLERAWDHVERAGLDPGRDVLEFVALDLDERAEARVKVYYRHLGEVDLDRVASLARRHDPALAAPVYRAVYGDEAPVNEPMTCLAFREGLDTPDEANLYLRLPSVVASDAEAADRVAAAMRLCGLDPRPHHDVASALAPLPLDSVVGLHELLSFRTSSGARPDLGVYFRFGVYDSSVDGTHA